jgi:hypothetical protein
VRAAYFFFERSLRAGASATTPLPIFSFFSLFSTAAGAG